MNFRENIWHGSFVVEQLPVQFMEKTWSISKREDIENDIAL